jgi:hypothetical protein
LDKQGIGGVVREIGAKRVFQVHTENAAAFKKLSKRAEITEKQKQYTV